MSLTSQPLSNIRLGLQRAAQLLAFFLLLALAVGLSGATLLAAFGALPWPEVTFAYGGSPVDAGPALQIGLTVLALALCAYLPANARIMALETSHRRFRMSMQDVVRAYSAAHAGDRAGAFTMSEQYDAVRERMIYLRDHPELGALEPDILETAAQMSTISRDLAKVYSDDAMSHARAFLKERQEECARFEDQIEAAKHRATEIRQWADAVEMDESVARAQIARLRDELADILPELSDPQIDPRLGARAANQLPAE